MGEKYIITGANGFVGRHLIKKIIEGDSGSEVFGIDLHGGEAKDIAPIGAFSFRELNLLDRVAVTQAIDSFSPTRLIHLAAISSVAESWKKPAETFLNNTSIFLNLVEIFRDRRSDCRLLSVGSSEEYGNVLQNMLPIREDCLSQPTSPYGVARLSQEALSRVYASGYGLNIILTRSFNHIGPGQRETFVVPSIVRQFVLAEREGKKKFKLNVGNAMIIRDFTDVSDVVEAYLLLLGKGRPGEVYNVCSGKGVRILELIAAISRITGIEAEIKEEGKLLRATENVAIFGDNSKIFSECGWLPKIGLDESLARIVDYWRNRP
jgi:GDP-4-dehydro-6-deoxy-D-mannose reductase